MDLLSEYQEATERERAAQRTVETSRYIRRIMLRRLRNDGMTVLQISRMVGLKAGTVSGMIQKAEREYQELMDDEPEPPQSVDDAPTGDLRVQLSDQSTRGPGAGVTATASSLRR